METFEVKRGMVKSVSSDGGLAKLAGGYFDDVSESGENAFEAAFGILSNITGHYDEKGKLVVDVVQMKGSDLEELLSADGGREKALESRRRWSGFLDEATGYNPKQRGDKAKESAKKASKAKSAIRQANHMMKMTEVDDSTSAEAEALITEIEEALDRGDNTRAASRGGKLGKLFEKSN
jgi:hypothetical protein